MAMKQISFKNKSQYGLYLRNTMSQQLKPDSFNIFVHCVTSAYPHTFQKIKEKDDVLYKVGEILRTGLDLDGNKERCPYGSINGIAKFVGEAQTVKLEDIIDYSFLCNSRFVNTIILAIPKYIQLNGSKQEFSSFNGKMDSYSPFNKSCLLDISKGRYLPTAFTLGYQLVDRETNTVKFWQNDQHFSQLPVASQDSIMQGFSTKINEVIQYCKTQHNADSIESMFQIMTDKHMELLEDYFNDI